MEPVILHTDNEHPWKKQAGVLIFIFRRANEEEKEHAMSKSPGTKPVKQCKGCELNLKTHCAIFHHPSLKWKGRNCEGYNNPMYIRHYEMTLKPEGARARKMERVAAAKESGTFDHRDGRKRAGRMA